MEEQRIRCKALLDKVMTAEQAAEFIKDGMVVGTSGFTPSGYPKAIPLALAEKIKKTGEKIQIDLLSGASTGQELDGALAEAGAIHRRMPYQTNVNTRKSLNTNGGICYMDQHLSLATQQARYGFYGDMDLAIVEPNCRLQ